MPLVKIVRQVVGSVSLFRILENQKKKKFCKLVQWVNKLFVGKVHVLLCNGGWMNMFNRIDFHKSSNKTEIIRYEFSS